MIDTYAPTAGAYDLFNQSFRSAQLEALEPVLSRFDLAQGPVLDIGAGSGLNTALVLERLPHARVLAVEPSPSMRALLLSRIANHADWHERVTVRPESIFDAPLPRSIAGALMLGVIGHFDSAERTTVFVALRERLPAGAPVLFDLQEPERPMRVAPFTFLDVRVGDLRYSGTGEAWPDSDGDGGDGDGDGDSMIWRMTYSTLEGDTVLYEATAEHRYHHPAHDTVRAETAAAGLRMERVGDSTYWVLTVG